MRWLLVIALLLPTVASADVVEPPPDRCPPGSNPSTGHSGPYCAPTAECSSDSACGEGSTCDVITQCIETRACGGRIFPDSGPCTIEHVVGPCAGDGTCAVGECRSRSVCDGGSGGGDGCGCHAAGFAPEDGTPWAIAAVLLAGLVVRRRRRS